jgi:hypothetical protein
MLSYSVVKGCPISRDHFFGIGTQGLERSTLAAFVEIVDLLKHLSADRDYWKKRKTYRSESMIEPIG